MCLWVKISSTCAVESAACIFWAAVWLTEPQTVNWQDVWLTNIQILRYWVLGLTAKLLSLPQKQPGEVRAIRIKRAARPDVAAAWVGSSATLS